jgi:hypothetical protein
MADIVLSYASEDRAQAELVADALEHSGWSVWWDRAILPGTSYRQVIEAQLSAARCVVVLWSTASRQSNWVHDEATLALDRNVLVSVIIDGSEPPLGFRQQQTANFAQWSGSAADPAFALLKQGIAHVVSGGSPPGRSTSGSSVGASGQVAARSTVARKWRIPLLFTIVILVLGVAGAGALMWLVSYPAQRAESGPALESSVSQERDRAPSSQALIVPAHATATLPRENVTLTILSGRLERLNADTRSLSLHIRFSNNGTRSFYRTYYSNLRLVIDGVLRAPTDAPIAQVDASSSGEFDYRFDVPVTANRAVLRIIHDDQTAEIPLDFAATAGK